MADFFLGKIDLIVIFLRKHSAIQPFAWDGSVCGGVREGGGVEDVLSKDRSLFSGEKTTW